MKFPHVITSVGIPTYVSLATVDVPMMMHAEQDQNVPVLRPKMVPHVFVHLPLMDHMQSGITRLLALVVGLSLHQVINQVLPVINVALAQVHFLGTVPVVTTVVLVLHAITSML
jgi:hypothetical protein